MGTCVIRHVLRCLPCVVQTDNLLDSGCLAVSRSDCDTVQSSSTSIVYCSDDDHGIAGVNPSAFVRGDWVCCRTREARVTFDIIFVVQVTGFFDPTDMDYTSRQDFRASVANSINSILTAQQQPCCLFPENVTVTNVCDSTGKNCLNYMLLSLPEDCGNAVKLDPEEVTVTPIDRNGSVDPGVQDADSCNHVIMCVCSVTTETWTMETGVHRHVQ